MTGALLLVFLTAFAVLALTKDEFKITSGRKVNSDASKAVGYVLVGGVIATLIFGSLLGIAALVLAVFLGLLMSEPVVKQQ